MTDRPINLTGDDVRALLSGIKTQQRVVLDVKAPGCLYGMPVDCVRILPNQMGAHFTVGDYGYTSPLPHAVGYRLWVRETFLKSKAVGGYAPHVDPDTDPDGATIDVIYRADDDDEDNPWRSSATMPRSLSRLTLIVTDVSVQRVQDISDDDAIAEGARPLFDEDDVDMMRSPNGGYVPMLPLKRPTDSYRKLWNARHKRPVDQWRANPWVCAITFRVVKQNIDEVTT